MKKKELFFYLLEVEDIIQAVENDIKKTVRINPALMLKKELSLWNTAHQAISATMDNLDYEELLMCYHDPSYQSSYFEGFNLFVDTLYTHKEEGDKKKLHLYVKEITSKNMAKIERDFL